ncbi:MAG: hypothetical protein ACYCPT_13700 [Acidimicrobiales bacterium]
MSDKRPQLIVPPHSVQFYEVGEPLSDVVQGDFIIVKHTTIFADAIQKGLELEAALHPELKGFTWEDHTGFVRNNDAGVPFVSEMGAKGYERRAVSLYQAELCARVRFEVSTEQIATACSYDKACDGVEYGWDLYLPLIVDGITGGTFIGSWGDALICSVHVSLVAMGMGLFPDRPVRSIDPATFTMWCDARHA